MNVKSGRRYLKDILLNVIFFRSDSATRGKSPSAMGYICIKIGDISFSGVLQVHTSSRMEIPRMVTIF